MIVKQVAFALQILELFAERKSPATLSEIADHFGWPRSSTFNLIETLSKAGYLYELRYRSGYYPTPRLLKLAEVIVAAAPVSDALKAMVEQVAARTGETAILAAPSGTSAVFVEVVESKNPIRYFAHVGQRVPLYATAAGRAILSLFSPRERATILDKAEYERFAAASLMNRQEVEEEIAISQARGWFFNNNGYSPDLLGVAIPLPLPDRHFCLLVAGPAYRLEGLVDTLVTEARDAIAAYVKADSRVK
ncbi:IclR family transcriptional regulator [Aquabacter cavernae]|uniref:IclR family transcriptional regulator n=1 Tax=Aquabacter cavernae TaxID=2496029 RepID=UPI000F8E1667|nr:IclR family transcriptional regulator [Aquabacter cavernae]